ncbi:MAG TPA: PKD domain-containing protein [Solirubrobacteraceae bacterium]|nr:PKD domain-containing protein [Solirubrobacteraceae bacterium]
MAATTAGAAAGDVGTRDFGYAPAPGSPTESKPESKLWFNEGGWWAVLTAPDGGQHIYRLAAGGGWQDTGTVVDARAKSRADVLWDAAAGKLYVASHVFSGTSSSAVAGRGRLWRFGYDPVTDRYALDAGFPVDINATAQSETLVIAKDSTGRLWATWALDGRVYVARTSGDDSRWGTPYVVPSGDPSVTADDISSVVAAGGGIDLLWSNQRDGRFWFARHPDGAGDAPGDWLAGPVPGTLAADDHINLKSDDAGRVYAAVKYTSSRGQPLVALLIREPWGAWTEHVFGVWEDHTRPIVALDGEHRVIHMFATCPHAGATSGQAGGDICEKTASMDAVGFTGGIGTRVISDSASAEMNDATSTKQDAGGAGALVVAANTTATRRYWHAVEPLGTPVRPLAPSFSAAPTSGTAPLTVSFTAAAAGSPTNWMWDLDGDGGIDATVRNPSFTYTRPGTYSVTLVAADAARRESATGKVTVAKGPCSGPGCPRTSVTPTSRRSVRDRCPRWPGPSRRHGCPAGWRRAVVTRTARHVVLRLSTSRRTRVRVVVRRRACRRDGCSWRVAARRTLAVGQTTRVQRIRVRTRAALSVTLDPRRGRTLVARLPPRPVT